MSEQRETDSPKPESNPSPEPTENLTPDSPESAESAQKSWTSRLSGLWNQATDRLKQLSLGDRLPQYFQDWFSVSDERVAEILTAVRAQLPTTEALLIGKPQAGKSSIVRGLTGVSADIIGQGFRPHTQHTERYAYPSSELPLLIFTDTVGLGDVNQDTEAIVQELVGDLQQETGRAKILILTVKINDFATDSLRQIAQQLRAASPHIPCLLAVTCLHEVYPPNTEDSSPLSPGLSLSESGI